MYVSFQVSRWRDSHDQIIRGKVAAIAQPSERVSTPGGNIL